MSEKAVIRELKTMDDLDATVDLQKAVWGMRDVEVSSPHTLKAVVSSGGAVIGAELDGRLAGFCFGFGALIDGEVWLWSHMTGVRPECQGRGLGYRLKQAQRTWALRQGYRVMAWTFDPMQAGNANFNFNRLGVIARRYSVNHYGDMQDGLNAGLASDRLVARWQLDEPRVVALASGERREDAPDLSGIARLVYIDEQGAIARAQPEPDRKRTCGIEIPLDIAELKRTQRERALQWQLHVRQAMTALLETGYIVSGFARVDGRGWYLLRQP